MRAPAVFVLLAVTALSFAGMLVDKLSSAYERLRRIHTLRSRRFYASSSAKQRSPIAQERRLAFSSTMFAVLATVICPKASLHILAAPADIWHCTATSERSKETDDVFCVAVVTSAAASRRELQNVLLPQGTGCESCEGGAAGSTSTASATAMAGRVQAEILLCYCFVSKLSVEASTCLK